MRHDVQHGALSLERGGKGNENFDQGRRERIEVAELPAIALAGDDGIDDRIAEPVDVGELGFELLPPRFTLTQLQRLYEIVLGTDLDKRNFRKKLLSMELLIETDELETGVRHRAARLYKFDRRKYDKLARHGFSFAI